MQQLGHYNETTCFSSQPTHKKHKGGRSLLLPVISSNMQLSNQSFGIQIIKIHRVAGHLAIQQMPNKASSNYFGASKSMRELG